MKGETKMPKMPIVCLRGINWYNQEDILFKNFKSFFLEKGFEVIIPQFKGCTINRTIKFLRKEIKEKYKLDKFVILGSSFGGLLAQRYYDKYPDEVLSMVLVNPVDSEGVSWRIIFKLFKNIVKGLASLSLRKTMGLVFYGDNFSDEDVKYYMCSKLNFKNLESPWIILELAPFMGKRVRRVKIPTLIVEGGKDNFLDLEYTRKIVNKLGTDHHIIFNAGHVIVAEPKLWEVASEIIYRWLQKNLLLK